MSGHTMFHVFLDVLFIANIALFFYLLHKKQSSWQDTSIRMASAN